MQPWKLPVCSLPDKAQRFPVSHQISHMQPDQDGETLGALLPLRTVALQGSAPSTPRSPFAGGHFVLPEHPLHPLRIVQAEMPSGGSAGQGVDSPSQQPFLASPRGVLTPRTLTR